MEIGVDSEVKAFCPVACVTAPSIFFEGVK